MLFVYIFITLCLLGWITFPVINQQSLNSTDPLLQERIQAKEAALKQLYATRESISESDFTNIERQLMVSLAKLLKKAGIEPNAQKLQAMQESPSDIPETETKNAFCGNCGTPLQASFGFCPQCGTPLKAA